MLKATKRTVVVMPSLQEDKVITAAVKLDPDAQPSTAKQLKAMVPMSALRGRPKLAGTKQLVSIRYSQEVLAYFRATGDGWQSRMDGVLRDYVSRRVRKA